MISATVTGRLTKEPELRFTNNSQAVADLRIASSNRGDGTSFIDVTIWGKPGEAAAEHLTKGQHITIAGTLEADEWTDNDNNKRTTWALTAHNSEWHAKPQTANAATN